VVNCDGLFTVPKSALGRRRGERDRQSLEQLGGALRIPLRDLDVLRRDDVPKASR